MVAENAGDVQNKDTVVVPDVKIEQKPEGVTAQPPIKKEEPIVTEQKVEEKVDNISVGAQERINRMYARLQKEREERLKAENELAVQRTLLSKPEIEDEEFQGERPQPKGLTEADVEHLLQRRELEKRFQTKETQVLMEHPEALNEDGSFNMSDPFVIKYIEIGKRNPYLVTVEDGPILAAAMAEKELGLSYNKGRKDEALNSKAAANASTGVSTIKVAPGTKIVLNDAEMKVARRFNMTTEEYAKNKRAK